MSEQIQTTPQGVVIKPQTMVVNFTPFALAKMSNGLFQCCDGYTAEDMPLLKYFLYCASIELGLKAAILSTANSPGMKKEMKTVGHDLDKAAAKFQACLPSEGLLDVADLAVLTKINPFFKKKGLEYVTLDVVVELVKGLKNFPSLDDLRGVAAKINGFLAGRHFFLDL